MLKFLITGGAGYIGSVLTPLLLNEGHDVTVLDRFYFNQASLLDCCPNPRFHIIRGDCRDENTLRKAVDGKDYIIPLAALVGFPLCEDDKVAAVTTNKDAINLLLSLRLPGQRVIFPCTNSGYGLGQGESFCTEGSPLEPISIYGRTKVEAEKAVLNAGDSLTFRFATLFGASPRMRTDLMVNDFVYRAFNDRTAVIFEGHFNRNFLHIRDAAGAFIYAVQNFEKMKGLPYNCGLSSANMSKIQLCEKIKEHLPSFVYVEAPVGEDPDKRNYIISNERLEKTGWEAKHSLDEGIEELIKVYSIIKNKAYSNI
ncbi:MAG: NAD(P)-dependent oxidoreductase [Oscillospiraceae bacterium]|nr:NAD(P)-dependent oxidoreductase [Oscillospiraceae bacterium]